ncbi:MAG: ribonuclease H-like domain-containing protein [Lentisphaeria bacterium]
MIIPTTHPCFQQAFRHFPGIGEKRLLQLQQAGIGSWNDLPAQCPSGLSCLAKKWTRLYDFAQENILAAEQRNWNYFAENLASIDRWRLLAAAWDQAVYLDIETTGIDYQAEVTVISCWDGQELRLFVKDENLDDFLDYAETVTLFATFNGSLFDIPVLQRYFHVPELSAAAHLDLRWVCRQTGLEHGLKSIERQLGIRRPPDLQDSNGEEAIWLWQRWQQHGNAPARNKLLRYCAADTIALQAVAAQVLNHYQIAAPGRSLPGNLWAKLDQQVPLLPEDAPLPDIGPQPFLPKESFPNTIHDPQRIMEQLTRFLNRKR